VIGRDLSEKIEEAIKHCEWFAKGNGHCDLGPVDQDWQVRICREPALTIIQSKVINGENDIRVSDKAHSIIRSIWILWDADRFFSPHERMQTLGRCEEKTPWTT
jgi:hypothetical protein